MEFGTRADAYEGSMNACPAAHHIRSRRSLDYVCIAILAVSEQLRTKLPKKPTSGQQCSNAMSPFFVRREWVWVGCLPGRDLYA